MNNDLNKLTPLAHFGFLAVTGKDAAKFLQGYTTCDVDLAQGDTSLLGAICNIQGRMLSNFRMIPIEDGLLLRMSRELVPAAIEFLGKYIVFSKASLEDLSDKIWCFGLTHNGDNVPKQTDTFTHNELTSDNPIEIAGSTLEGWLIKVDMKADDDDAHFEVWSKKPLQADQAVENWMEQEVRSGIAWVETETTEAYIPQMFNLQNLKGISFEKGCYLGQEIVARMQFRGELKKRLHLGSIQSSSSMAVSLGDNIENETGKNVGQIIAVGKDSFLSVVQTKSQKKSQDKSTESPSYQLSNGDIVELQDLYLSE